MLHIRFWYAAGLIMLLIASTLQSGAASAQARTNAPHQASAPVVFGSMMTKRTRHTATLLPDGTVLIVGGADIGGNALASAEILDPQSGLWRATSSMHAARVDHTATLLLDGTVLVAGGHDAANYDALASAEIYDPATGQWHTIASMAARAGHTATRLLNGTVLVTGNSRTAEIYVPHTGLWHATGDMIAARTEHTATLLRDGRVLVAGGYGDGDAGPANVLASAEIFDPEKGQWQATSSMHHVRFGHTATLLADGSVLVVGGYDGSFWHQRR